MIFSVQSHDDKLVERIYNKAMKELNGFFRLGWKQNKPRIFMVKDRNTINRLMGKNTAEWVVGWANNIDIFILDKDNYEKESCHKYSEKEYSKLIKHELAHVFTMAFLGIFNKPIYPDWLWEGVAIYLSGQNKTRKKPSILKEFLQYYSNDSKNPGVYRESGFVIEFLLDNYGRQKLLKLIKSTKNANSKEQFSNKFKQIYGFELNYKNFQNKLI
ncbi:MAG: hypothetical protein PHO02_06830 [Candidatus Nanoarchaeia archaeon]|nr:hypothetical protein [Candidatus Nanoarchaeia archaeon]